MLYGFVESRVVWGSDSWSPNKIGGMDEKGSILDIKSSWRVVGGGLSLSSTTSLRSVARCIRTTATWSSEGVGLSPS